MNRDDEFFRLPRVRNPLRQGRDDENAGADSPTRKPGEPDPIAERIPPIVSSKTSSATAASTAAAEIPHRNPAVANAQQANPSSPGMPHAPARPASPRRLWVWPLFGVGVVGVVLVGGLTGYWLFMNIAARLELADQPIRIRLPETTDLVLRTNDNKIDVLMKGTIYAQVPLKQTLLLPIKGVYDTDIDLDTQVPLETVITYEGVIPIDTIADIEAKAPVNFQNVKKYKNLHFKAKLPMRLQLPVKLVVPIKQNIPLRYKGPLRVTIDHTLTAPVDTVLNTALKVNQQFSVPITTELPVRLQLPQTPTRATITEADLFLNLETLRLERKSDPGTPAATAQARP